MWFSAVCSDMLGEEEESSEMPIEDSSNSEMETQSETIDQPGVSVGRKLKNQKKKFDISLPAQHLVRSQLNCSSVVLHS